MKDSEDLAEAILKLIIGFGIIIPLLFSSIIGSWWLLFFLVRALRGD